LQTGVSGLDFHRVNAKVRASRSLKTRINYRPTTKINPLVFDSFVFDNNGKNNRRKPSLTNAAKQKKRQRRCCNGFCPCCSPCCCLLTGLLLSLLLAGLAALIALAFIKTTTSKRISSSLCHSQY
jgi:hypothetical protein